MSTVQGSAYFPFDEAALGRAAHRVGGRRRHRSWLMRRVLPLADVTALTLAFLLAQHLLAPSAQVLDHVSAASEALLFLATLPVWVFVAKCYGLYDRDVTHTDHSTADDLVGVLNLVTVGAWIVVVASVLAGFASPSIVRIALFWVLAVTLVIFARATARSFARNHALYVQRTVVVGAGDVGQLVAHKFRKHPECGIELVGFIDDDPRPRIEGLEDVPVLGSTAALTAIVHEHAIERVVIAFSSDTHDETLHLVRALNEMDVQVDIVPRLFEVLAPGMEIHSVEGMPLVGLRPFRLPRSSRLLKRSLDLGLASVGLLVLAPFFALTAVMIKTTSPGPVFFRQERVGVGGKSFRIFKFRTMTADAEERKDEITHLNMHARAGGDARMFKVPNDPRVTRVGGFLRRFSLDELPQLLNVLNGEMTLVGPRPLIPEEDQYVAGWFRRRLRLKPGVTGLWQVLGSSEIPFAEMTRLDYLYVANWSLWNDLRLILKTIPAICRTRQAY